MKPIGVLQVQVGEEGEPRMAPVPRLLLNEIDARAALGDISRSKLYDLVSRGQLRAVKLGPGRRAGIRFRIQDLQEFAERHLADRPPA